MFNLGSHFDLPQEHWSALARRIEELLLGQRSMLDVALPEQVQAFAQRFAAQIIARKPAVPSLGSAPSSTLQDKLSELGLNRPQIAAAVGNVVARMAQPLTQL